MDEVLARTGFVAEAPDDDGGVVDVGVNHLHVAGDVGGAPLDGMRKRLLAVVILVALDVRLVFEIDAILVTEVIPVGAVGIVGAADVVDVGALHEHDFLFHLIAGDGVAAVGAGLVAVDPFELHSAAVDVEVAAGESELVVFGFRVLNFDFAETDGGRYGLDCAAFLVFEFADEGVAPGFFGRPFHRIGDVEDGAGGLAVARGSLIHFYLGPHAIHETGLVAVKGVGVERVGHLVALGLLFREVAHVGRDGERAVDVVVVQVGDDDKVTHMDLGL